MLIALNIILPTFWHGGGFMFEWLLDVLSETSGGAMLIALNIILPTFWHWFSPQLPLWWSSFTAYLRTCCDNTKSQYQKYKASWWVFIGGNTWIAICALAFGNDSLVADHH